MTTIYHNPRCSKSREALQILEDREKPFSVRKYLEDPPSIEEIKEILKALNIKPMELVRTQEKEWKENFAGRDLSDEEVLEAMVQFPKLIERPIVLEENRAVIGRPPQRILEILK